MPCVHGWETCGFGEGIKGGIAMKRLALVVILLVMVVMGFVTIALSYDCGCISSCMQRGGLYEQCVKQCGGY